MKREIQVHIILCEAMAVSTYYSRQDQLVYISTNSVMSIFDCSRSTASRIMDAVTQAYRCFYISYDQKGRKLLMWVPEELWYAACQDMDEILAARKRIDREFSHPQFRDKDYEACLIWHNQYLQSQSQVS